MIICLTTALQKTQQNSIQHGEKIGNIFQYHSKKTEYSLPQKTRLKSSLLCLIFRKSYRTLRKNKFCRESSRKFNSAETKSSKLEPSIH